MTRRSCKSSSPNLCSGSRTTWSDFGPGKLSDPPSYSSVRTMIRSLEAKGLLRHRQDGSRHIYRPARSREAAMRSALRHVMQTFFAGSAASVVEAILHPSVARLTSDEIERLERLIQQARHQEQGGSSGPALSFPTPAVSSACSAMRRFRRLSCCF
jgi:predicted transcriptional regulator